MENNKDIEKKAQEGIRNFENDGGDIDGLMDDLHDAIDGVIDSQKSGIPTIHELDPETEYVDAPTYNYKWMLALLLVGLIGSFLFNSIQNKAPKNHVIYAESFEPFPDIITSTLRGSETTKESALTDAMSLYEQGKYKDAIAIYNTYNGNASSMANAQFYKAISQLSLGKIEEANQTLTNLSKNQDASQISDAVKWYLGLSHLKLGQYDDVKRIFGSLPTSHYKYENATSILNKLSK